MDHMSDHNSGMGHMDTTFFSGTGTSLYSNAFTPTTTGGYAGTCIFLIIFTLIYRSLFAFKAIVESRWTKQAYNRRFVVVADRTPEAERIQNDPDAKTGLLTANGVEESVKVVQARNQATMPWRLSVDLPRALLVTVMVGMGYLLMLAVMTLNVGYFLSVLGGAFLGELLVGRYNFSFDEHH